MAGEFGLDSVNEKKEGIFLTVEAVQNVNYALQQRGTQIISEIRINNNTEKEYSNLEIEISFYPAFAKQTQVLSTHLAANTELVLRKIAINVDGDYLASLTERVNGNMTVLCKSDNETVCMLEKAVALLAFDECFGFWFMPELLGCFSQPNHPDIPKILVTASKLLGEWTGSSALDAYQSEDRNRVIMQAAAIYGALQQCNITYAVAPAGFEQNGQRVRTADVILSEHLGNCLDLSLLYTACLEAAGLNPIVVLVEGHSFPGVWLSEECFSETVQDESSVLSKRIAAGVGEICLIETTMLCSGMNISFTQAQQIGEKNLLTKPFHMVVDIKRARAMGIRPLPRRELRQSGYRIVHEERSHEELTTRPAGLDVIYTNVCSVSKTITKFDIWQRKLLDLTKRNALINLRLTRNMLPVLTSSLSKLEDALFEKRDFRILPKSDEWKFDTVDDNFFELVSRLTQYEQSLELDFINGDIRIPYTATEVEKSVTQLYRKSRVDMEENGANTLYLALGALKWYETEHTSRSCYAPIVLIPVDIIRKSARVGYVIRRRDDDAQLNITLLEMLRQNYNIEVRGLDPLPQDEHGVDMNKIMSIMRHEVMHKNRWDVVESAFLGNFSFAQFVMWNDLCNRSEDLKANKIVRSLEEGRLCWEPAALVDTIEEKDVMLPIVADSSQMKAIDAASKNNSFVLHGPPGTGKSQTITSMIANAVANGKTVLFVAQKMAALSVVKKRLDRIGIGQFCLEIHSNKANKKDVLDQLESVLKLAGTVQNSDYEQIFNNINIIREELDSHKKALHKTYHFGLSLYDAISRSEFYADINYDMNFSIKDMEQISSEQIRSNELLVDELISVARVIGHPHRHVLGGIGMLNYTQQVRIDAANSLGELIETIVLMQKVSENLTEKTSSSFSGSVLELYSLYDLANQILLVKDQAEEKLRVEEYILSDFDKGILDLPLQELLETWRKAENSWFLPSIFAHNKIKNRIVPYFINGKITKAKIEECLNQLSKRAEVVSRCRALINALPTNIHNSYEQLFNVAYEFKTCFEEFKNKYKKVCDILEPTNEFYSLETVDGILGIIASWRENISVLRDYAVWNYSKKKAVDNGLSPLVEALENGLPLQVTKDAYLKALYRSMAEYIFNTDENNARFNGLLFDEKVKSFKRLNDELQTQTRREILNRLSNKIPNLQTLASQNSELGILQRAIKSGGRGIAIRKLLEQLPTLLPKLCPCMLMSPISAAQYLDPKRQPFDIVIFDEASQMPTCEAVGVMARAKEAVIVGDPKQMPPTSFFSSNNTNEESPELEDMESILDDCLALSMPETNLKWHYRSRHESLIAFSNREYYENVLYTFPSPDALSSKVQLIPVEGYYDKGKTRQNRSEAEAIVKEIERRLESKSKQSIGVVTFSVAQQSLVEDLLNDLFVRRPELDALANDVEEPLFVKNLENVQGDERDVILFSICYGPDKNGNMTMNFGPLNRPGGWRRLNVAITRAREEMFVFSLLKYDQINLSNSSADGVRGLRSFLEYAKSNTDSNNKNKKNATDGIAEAIVNKLKYKGYEANISVGVSLFRVDVGVLSPTENDKYILGILLDGGSYAQADSVHDRELSLKSILNDLGWKVLRIYAIDWWENSERELERIVEAINAKDEFAEVQDWMLDSGTKQIEDANMIAEGEPVSDVKTHNNMRLYELANLPYAEMKADEFINLHDSYILGHCRSVLEVEAPIAESLLVKRILASFGITRASSRVSSKVITAVRSLNVSPIRELSSYVYYNGLPEDYKVFRISESKEAKRDAKELPMIEVMNAAQTVLEQQYGLPENDLIKETAKLLGYARLGSYVEVVVREGVNRLIQSGKIVKSETGNITMC